MPVDLGELLLKENLDRETAEAAFELALDGRLVLATVSGNDAPSIVSLLLSLGVGRFAVATAVNLIQAQCLVRRLCPECRVDDSANVPSQSLVDMGFPPDQIESFRVMKATGCGACAGTGYKGRVGLFETMEMSDGLAELVKRGAPELEIRRGALAEGMLTLRLSGLEKIRSGVTTIEEVLRETVL